MDWRQAVAGTAIAGLLGYLTWHYWTHGRSRKPGSLPEYPFLGAIPSFLGHEAELFEFLTGVLEESPSMSFTTFVPGVKWFFTANPDHLQHILKDNFSNYPKGDDLRDHLQDLLGHGIFAVDGEQWKQQRKMASYEFSTNSLRNLTLVSIQEEIQNRLLPTLDSAVGSTKAIDMHDVLLRFTFDTICRVGFGVDLGVLSPEFPQVPFANCVDKATTHIMTRGLVPDFVWRAKRSMNLGSEKTFADTVKVIDEFLLSVVEKRRRELAGDASSAVVSEGTNLVRRSDLLSRMFALEERDKGQMFTDTFLRDACMNFVIAGRDTSAVSLSWFFLQLTKHPEVEQKILAELQSIIGRRDKGDKDRIVGPSDREEDGIAGCSDTDKDRPLSFEELKQMTYTQAALNESMRLFAPVPVDQRLAVEDDTLPDGTFIEKGSRTSYVIFAVGRMKRVWGEDALEFKPERWIAEDGQLKVESPFKFPVFNAGPRLCLGREMAYLQMKSVVASVLQRYRLQVVPGHKVQYALSLTMLMKNKLPMIISVR